MVVLLEEREDNKGPESQMELREKKGEKYVNKKRGKGQDENVTNFLETPSPRKFSSSGKW